MKVADRKSSRPEGWLHVGAKVPIRLTLIYFYYPSKQPRRPVLPSPQKFAGQRCRPWPLSLEEQGTVECTTFWSNP